MQARGVSETRVKVVKSRKPMDVQSESTESRATFALSNGTLPETQFRSLAERVAGHRIYQRNVSLPFLKEAFPSSRHMWSVDRFFPYSIHGALYMDEPGQDFQVEESLRKKAEFEKLGLKLIILGPKANYQSAMEQLAEFAPCPGQSIQQ